MGAAQSQQQAGQSSKQDSHGLPLMARGAVHELQEQHESLILRKVHVVLLLMVPLGCSCIMEQAVAAL